jgi:phosphonate transport system substrate-binding protein
MSRTIWVGAVAYDPKVVTIWEGMRRYFHEEAHLPVEVVLFQSYEMQVAALLAGPADLTPRIDIAWNTNLAYLQADVWSDRRCRPIAMRDTDLGWMTKIVAVTGGPISGLSDLKNRTLALGSRDSGRTAIPAPARSRSFAPCSTVAPTPGRSAVRSGRRCGPSGWCRRGP